MDITCYRCKTIFTVPEGSMRIARLKHALGYKDFLFTCPSCGAKNSLTAEEFHTNDHPEVIVPVTGAKSAPKTMEEVFLSRTNESATPAPTNPVEGPDSEMRRQAIVRLRGVETRRDHNNWAEITGGFSQGERITILNTWSDGENTWVQLGPERWVNLDQNGEPVLDLID